MNGKPQPPKVYVQEGSGRPSKFTEKRRNDIIDAVSHRIPYELAAEANGITLSTLYEWFKIGRMHTQQGIDSDYTVFSEALKRAEMTKVREHSDMIAAKPERWQADAWLLERRWSKYYGPNAQVNELNQRLSRIENAPNGEPSGQESEAREETSQEE